HERPAGFPRQAREQRRHPTQGVLRERGRRERRRAATRPGDDAADGDEHPQPEDGVIRRAAAAAVLAAVVFAAPAAQAAWNTPPTAVTGTTRLDDHSVRLRVKAPGDL